jgi:hypothetical protein
MTSSQNAKKLSRGDIVEIEWLDTHSTDRLTHVEIEDLEEPGPTVAYGIVLKNGSRYLTIASELCLDSVSDGNWVEQIPHGSIRRIRKLGKRNIDLMEVEQ